MIKMFSNPEQCSWLSHEMLYRRWACIRNFSLRSFATKRVHEIVESFNLNKLINFQSEQLNVKLKILAQKSRF